MTSPTPIAAAADMVRSSLSLEVFHDCLGAASAPIVTAVISGKIISLLCSSPAAATIPAANRRDTAAGSIFLIFCNRFTFSNNHNYEAINI